jgi:hypothetical protein
MPILRWSLSATLVALSFALPCTAAAQLAPGTRVRVHSSDVVLPVIGNYQGMRRDTLVVIEDGVSGQQWMFTSANVSRLEVSAGMKGRNKKPMTRWALIGGGAGAALGIITALALEGASDSEYNYALSGLVGLGVGAGAGALYGARYREEHWTSVSLPRRVGVVPSRSGFRVGLSASF